MGDSTLFITDFGSACRHGFPRGTEGGPLTSWYQAPEIWAKSAKSLDASTDIWAMGCCLVELALQGKPLFPHDTAEEALPAMKVSSILPKPDHVLTVRATDEQRLSVEISWQALLENEGSKLRSQLSAVGLDESMIMLILKMLDMEPASRILALDALEELGFSDHEYSPLPSPQAEPPGVLSWTVGDMSLEGEPLKELLTLRRSFDTTLTIDETRACFSKLAALHPLVEFRA